ncbi:hypothetical protein FG386_001751 [Cryptosporidium ryanae]|uniref:uncharacterized protein n=1 Tax=Cryptosporidium ryanae TaxID=515981 RepID=UPI00351A6A42|nr:hypothetical protein FG386_001751 [Cryptosporidium ryanae]
MLCVGCGINHKVQAFILVIIFFVLKYASKAEGNASVEVVSDADDDTNGSEEGSITYMESPCNNELLSRFKNCVSLNPVILNKRKEKTRYHSSLLYLADYIVEENGVVVKEKVVLKRSVGLNTLKLNNTEEEGLSSIRIQENDEANTSYLNTKVDKEEGEIMKYLQDSNYKYMPKLIDPNCNNTGWLVIGYFDGISLQEFYQGIYKDVDDIKIQNDHKFQDRMVLKKGVIYKELHDYLGKKDADRDDFYFSLLLSQYNSISHVYVELLKKGIIHCNMSPSSIMIKKGKLGMHPDDIVILDYSNSVRWNTETTQVFFSDIKQSCVPDLRPILAFLLSDFNVYIPLSSLDVTFFGRISLAPLNIVSTIEESAYSGQCIDYNNLFRDYYNTHFNCKDLLVDYKINDFNFIDCNTQLPHNTALPYNFKVFHFCQKTCGVCNKECESLVSIMNNDLYEETLMDDDLDVHAFGSGRSLDDGVDGGTGTEDANEYRYERYNSYGRGRRYAGQKSESVIREKLIKKLFKACKTNYELLSRESFVNHWINDLWVEEINGDEIQKERSESLLLGCKWCIKHQKVLQSILIYYDLPYIVLYPNIDLFIGDVNVLINSHKTIENMFKNYLVNLNADVFRSILSGNAPLYLDEKGKDKNRNCNFLHKWRDAEYRNSINHHLFIRGEFCNSEFNLINEYENVPSGLLYYRIVRREFIYINVKIIKHAFVGYMFKGFSSKYRERVIEMLRTYSLKLLPSSLKNFLVYY